MGVDGRGCVAQLGQQPDGGGQGLIDGLLQGGEGVPFFQEGGGQPGEELHFHPTRAAAAGVGQETAVGAGLGQAVEDRQGVRLKVQPRQPGHIEEALRGNENDVRGFVQGQRGLVGVGVLQEVAGQLRRVQVGLMAFHLDTLAPGGVQPQGHPHPVVPVQLAPAGLVQGQGGLLQRAGVAGGAQKPQGQASQDKPGGDGYPQGLPLPGQQDQQEQGENRRRHSRRRGQELGGGVPGDVPQAAHHGEVAELQGGAVDVPLDPAHIGQEHQYHRPRQAGPEEPAGETVQGEAQAGKEEPEEAHRRRVAGHPGEGGRQTAQPDGLGDVQHHQGCQQDGPQDGAEFGKEGASGHKRAPYSG